MPWLWKRVSIMPVGDCQRAFGAAAEEDGLLLGPSRLPWINQRGHFGLPSECEDVTPQLEAIFVELGGDPVVQSAKRARPLTGDFVEFRTGALIEIDEVQHFTSFRAASLGLYGAQVRLGFDRAVYFDLCRELAPRSDRYRAAKDAVGFGPGGRQRQRAYNDALVLYVPAFAGLAHSVAGRFPVLSLVGALVSVGSMVGFGGVRAVQGVQLGLVRSGIDRAEAVALLDGAGGNPVMAAFLLLFLGGTVVGLGVLVVALWRSRQVPRTPLVLVLVFLLFDIVGMPLGAVVDDRLLPVLAHTVLLVALGWLGLRTLRSTGAVALTPVAPPAVVA